MATLLRKFSLWAALAGITAIIFMVFKTTAAEPMPPLPVEPAQKPAERVIAASGMIEALHDNTNIGIPVSGLVVKVFVKEWDKVSAGSPLLRLDDRDLQAQLKTQQAELIVLKAELEKSQRPHKRTEKLLAAKAVSQSEADIRRDEFIVAQARVEAARAGIKQTEVLIERLTVRAPIDGTILQIHVRAGEYVIPGANPAPVLLGSINEFQVRADVDEQLAPRVKPGSRAVGYLKGDTRNSIQMEFVRIEPYITPKRNLTGSSTERVDTRVLQVIYKFPNNIDKRIYVGQQMNLFIEE